jgi:hypothetical protein
MVSHALAFAFFCTLDIIPDFAYNKYVKLTQKSDNICFWDSF